MRLLAGVAVTWRRSSPGSGRVHRRRTPAPTPEHHHDRRSTTTTTSPPRPRRHRPRRRPRAVAGRADGRTAGRGGHPDRGRARRAREPTPTARSSPERRAAERRRSGARRSAGAHVVLDPGHGGEEPGAVGPAGTLEKAVNLAIAQETQAAARGPRRHGRAHPDGRLPHHAAVSRRHRHEPAAAAVRVDPPQRRRPTRPATPRGPRRTSRSTSPESKRAAGPGVRGAGRGLRRRTTSRGSADRDAGAKYRPNMDGIDYYGILRRSAGVPAVLSEAAFISNPAEEALLADPAFQTRRGHGAHRGHRPLRHHRRPRQRVRRPVPADRTRRAAAAAATAARTRRWADRQVAG